MAECKAAAPEVEPLAREGAEISNARSVFGPLCGVGCDCDIGEHLRRESLVDFPDRNVLKRQSVACEQARDRISFAFGVASKVQRIHQE